MIEMFLCSLTSVVRQPNMLIELMVQLQTVIYELRCPEYFYLHNEITMIIICNSIWAWWSSIDALWLYRLYGWCLCWELMIKRNCWGWLQGNVLQNQTGLWATGLDDSVKTNLVCSTYGVFEFETSIIQNCWFTAANLLACTGLNSLTFLTGNTFQSFWLAEQFFGPSSPWHWFWLKPVWLDC